MDFYSSPFFGPLVFGCECWLGVQGASPLELNVTKYQISELFRTIDLGGSAGIIVSPSRAI